MSFNYHSALTTFKIIEGEYFPLPVEKSLFIILNKVQNDMKETFKKKLCFLFGFFIRKINLEETVKKVFTKNIDSVPFSWINPNFSLEKNLEFKDINFNSKITSENFLFFLDEIIEFCKSSTIQLHKEIQTINLCDICNEIQIKQTNLKSLLKTTTKTKLEFNYINKKNLNISFNSYIFEHLQFCNKNSKHQIVAEFSISKNILSLLLIPERYSKLKKNLILEIKGIYTLRMYKLLEEHMKKKKLELTKEELFNFFTLPTSYGKKTHLINKMLKPTLDEIEKIAGIQTEVQFYPKHNWETVTFTFKKVPIINSSKTIEEKIPELTQSISFNSQKIIKATEKMKRNIYVSRAWNSNVETIIGKLLKSDGEDFCAEVLKNVYENLKQDVTKSLDSYIQGTANKMKKMTPKISMNIGKAISVVNSTEIIDPIQIAAPVEIENIERRNSLLWNLYETFDKEQKFKLEEKAKRKYLLRVEKEEMTSSLEKFYNASRNIFILEELKNSYGSNQNLNLQKSY